MTTFDPHSLQGYSTIASVSGTNPTLSITVQTGEGARFSIGQNVTIWPPFTLAVRTNSTIGRITNIVGDVLSVTTAQEGSGNITVAALMQIANTITPKVLTDIESAINTGFPTDGGAANTVYTNIAKIDLGASV